MWLERMKQIRLGEKNGIKKMIKRSLAVFIGEVILNDI